MKEGDLRIANDGTRLIAVPCFSEETGCVGCFYDEDRQGCPLEGKDFCYGEDYDLILVRESWLKNLIRNSAHYQINPKRPEASKCGDCAMFENEDVNGDAWCDIHQKPVKCNNKACADGIKKGGNE